MVYFERQLLQCEQDELKQRGIVGGFGIGEPGIEQPVTTNSDEPAGRRQQLIYDEADVRSVC